MAELLFFRDDVLQMRAPLRLPRLVLGRAPESDLVLPDRAVSRTQCEVVARGSGHVLLDRSGRGTRVSHRTATETGTPLRDGDELRLGELVVLYSTAAPPAPDPDRPDITLPGGRRSARQTGRLSTRASSEGVRARLRVAGPHGETVAPLRSEEGFRLVIGSSPQAPQVLIIEDRFVSSAHCQIAMRDGQWVLTDLKSSNGTFVDGVRIFKCALDGRATLRVGETTVVFEQDRQEAFSLEPLPALVTRDPAMMPVVELVRRVAPSRAPVAIHGETGTGKEVVAHAIHLLSERRNGPFVALNCGAIPRDTVESELFGHERGAFTGAEKARSGAFEEASGGTLFLDEVGDLPLDIQVKLLRTLERGELRRLGSNRTLQVDVRVVSATHVDMVAAVDEGSFREDLFYRLCVVPVELPPLRQRIADILPLAEHFATQLAPGPARVTFSPSARVKLEAHSWPGNARELRNVVQAALLLRRGDVITDDDLQIRAPRRKRPAPALRMSGLTLADIEREAFRLALERHEWDKKAAMEELGVARSTFFRKLDEFGLAREAG